MFDIILFACTSMHVVDVHMFKIFCLVPVAHLQIPIGPRGSFNILP